MESGKELNPDRKPGEDPPILATFRPHLQPSRPQIHSVLSAEEGVCGMGYIRPPYTTAPVKKGCVWRFDHSDAELAEAESLRER